MGAIYRARDCNLDTDVGVEGGLPFAVMQYVSGGNLEDRRPENASGQTQPMPADRLSD